MRPADEIHWVNMSVEADEVLASFNWYSASTDREESTVVVNMAEEIAKLQTELTEANQLVDFFSYERNKVQQEADKLRAAIERVRALHKPDDYCCGKWGCPTLRAIDEEDA